MRVTRIIAIVALVCAAGCTQVDRAPDAFLRHYGVSEQPTVDRIGLCLNFGCRQSRQVAIDPNDWRTVSALFESPPADAESERRQIALAVARLESLAGARAGFFDDRAGNAWPSGSGHQLDCIDEAINTTVFLLLLQQHGLLRDHRVGHPAGRFFPRFSPHNTAVVIERESGVAYAIDSWFHDNGIPPEVVPLADWEAGYRPESRTRDMAVVAE